MSLVDELIAVSGEDVRHQLFEVLLADGIEGLLRDNGVRGVRQIPDVLVECVPQREYGADLAVLHLENVRALTGGCCQNGMPRIWLLHNYWVESKVLQIFLHLLQTNITTKPMDFCQYIIFIITLNDLSSYCTMIEHL